MRITQNSRGWYTINHDDQEIINKMVEYSYDRTSHRHAEVSKNEEEISFGQGGGTSSPNWMDTLWSLRVEVGIFKANNERLVRSQKNQVEINAVILQIFSNL